MSRQHARPGTAWPKLNGWPGLAKVVYGRTRPQLWKLVHERGSALGAPVPHKRRGSALSLHNTPEFDFFWSPDVLTAEDHATTRSESSDYVQPPAAHDQLRDQHL
ncbi:hypothetical protein BJV78DRAFT_1156538 [Lactifluus subvellereus]|nr:hypothetical protein BJV78DRAFT_1156538 [Lactifluus subvellereus]